MPFGFTWISLLVLDEGFLFTNVWVCLHSIQFLKFYLLERMIPQLKTSMDILDCCSALWKCFQFFFFKYTFQLLIFRTFTLSGNLYSWHMPCDDLKHKLKHSSFLCQCIFRNLEGWWCVSYVPCFWKSHAETICGGWTWDSGKLLMTLKN